LGTDQQLPFDAITPAKIELYSLHAMKLLAIVLIAIGIIAFAYQGIRYTSQDKVVDVGPLHVTAERSHTLPLPPIAGAIALAGGLALLFMNGRTAR
jgi:hypothetical protein